MKILKEIISYEANLPRMIVRLDASVIRIDKEVGEELKDEFQMVGMAEANKWNYCGVS